MLQPAEQSLLGDGWKEVVSFEEIDDSDEYESAEEGMDTPHPFLKIGSQLLRGDLTPLIGDEVILGLIRNPSNPSQPSHPPLHATSHRLTFSPVSLVPHDAPEASPTKPADAFPSNEPPPTRGLFPYRDPASATKSAPGVGRELGGPIPAFMRASPGSSSLFATGHLEGVDQGGEGSEQGRTRRFRGPNRQRVVVADMDELRALDFEIMDDRAIIEVGTGEERLVFAKKKAERVAAGLPMSGRGSRGGRLTNDPRSEKPAIMVGGLAKVRYPKSGGGGDTKRDAEGGDEGDEENEEDHPPAGAVYLAVGGGATTDKSKGSKKIGRKSRAQKEKEKQERELRRSSRPEPSGEAVPEGEEDHDMAEEQEVAVAVAEDEQGGDHEMADDEIPWQEVNEDA